MMPFKKGLNILEPNNCIYSKIHKASSIAIAAEHFQHSSKTAVVAAAAATAVLAALAAAVYSGLVCSSQL